MTISATSFSTERPPPGCPLGHLGRYPDFWLATEGDPQRSFHPAQNESPQHHADDDLPSWSFGQLLAGIPEFKTMKPYIPKGLSMKHLGLFMNKTFSGRLTADKISAIRDRWKGKLVVKGIVNPEDAEKAIKLVWMA